MRKAKLLAAGTAGIAAISLVAACGSGTGSGTGSGSSSASGSSSVGSSSSSSASAGGSSNKKVVYIPGLTGNPFYNTVSCGAASEAKKLGVSYSYQGNPTFGVPQQTQVLNSVVATKPGAIMISITDPQAMIGPLKVAKADGIKIITIDGDVNDKSVASTNIQADGNVGGALAGNALAKAVGEKGTVLIIDNATGSVVSEARTSGFKKAIAKYPNMKVLPIQYSNNDVSKAAQIVSTTSGSNSSVVGVFGVETNNTQGALTGVRESGKTGKIKVVGYDTSDPIVAALKNKSLTGTVVQYPRGEGMTGVKDAVELLGGKGVPRSQAAPQIFVTPATVNTAKAQQYIYNVNCKG